MIAADLNLMAGSEMINSVRFGKVFVVEEMDDALDPDTDAFDRPQENNQDFQQVCAFSISTRST